MTDLLALTADLPSLALGAGVVLIEEGAPPSRDARPGLGLGDHRARRRRLRPDRHPGGGLRRDVRGARAPRPRRSAPSPTSRCTWSTTRSTFLTERPGAALAVLRMTAVAAGRPDAVPRRRQAAVRGSRGAPRDGGPDPRHPRAPPGRARPDRARRATPRGARALTADRRTHAASQARLIVSDSKTPNQSAVPASSVEGDVRRDRADLLARR